MEEIKTRGIVISAKDYKDSDKLVTIFSFDYGIIRARVRGVKKNKAKLAFAVQPFAFIEFMLSARNGFYTVINATSIDQFFEITNDFDNYIFMLACLEICEKTVKENDPNKELFLLLLECLNAVCYNNVSAMIVFIKFMMSSSKLSGFSIVVNECSLCGQKFTKKSPYFSFDYNGFICPKCANNNDFLELTLGEQSILYNISNTDIKNLQNLKFSSRNDLVSVISLLCKDFRLLTDEEIVSIKKFL